MNSIKIISLIAAVLSSACYPGGDQEITYHLTIPRKDNSGDCISAEAYAELSKKLSDHFGGVSVQPTDGCWYDSDNDKLVCESSYVFSSSRDCDDVQSLQETYGTSNCEEIRGKHDRPFVRDLAKEYGVKLGQSTIYVKETIGSISFVDGERKEKAEEKWINHQVKEFDFKLYACPWWF